MKKIYLVFITVIVIFIFSISVCAADEQPSGSTYQYATTSNGTSYGTYWIATSATLRNLFSVVYNINDRLPHSSSYVSVGVSGGTSTSQTDYWRAVTYSLMYIGDDINTIKNDNSSIITYIDGIEAALSTTTSTLSTISSRINTSNSHLNTIKGYLSDLHDIFANQTDLNLKDAAENNVISATSDFFSSSSNTSVKTSNIGQMKTVSSGAQSFFSMGSGVSGTEIFTAMSDQSSDGPWMWFTSAVQNDLSSVNRNRNFDEIDFYTQKMEDLYVRIGDR